MDRRIKVVVIARPSAQIRVGDRFVALAVGGMDKLWGALLMGALLNFLSLRGVFGSYDDAVFAGILIVIMLFAPSGLLARAKTWWPFSGRPRGGTSDGKGPP